MLPDGEREKEESCLTSLVSENAQMLQDAG